MDTSFQESIMNEPNPMNEVSFARARKWVMILVGLTLLGVVWFSIFAPATMIAFVSVIGLIMLSCGVACLVEMLLAARSNTEQLQRLVSQTERMERLLEDQTGQLRTLGQLASMSEQAKSLIYHQQEVDALSESVNAMLLAQDYAGAETMLKRVEQQAGLAEEAARLRSEITASREHSVEDKIDAAIVRITQRLELRDWARAERESKRLLAMFPDHERIAKLPTTVSHAHGAYKAKLLREYSDAVKINDVERSIELLKELDHYLTPQEGAALAESARDVFKKRLHNLGVQFAIAVADRQWTDAIATGGEIMNEFPNTRMAREVRENMTILQEKQKADEDA